MGRDKHIEDAIYQYRGDDFNKTRSILLQNNFVITKLLKNLRKRFNIPENGFVSNDGYNKWFVKAYKNNYFESIGTLTRALSQKLSLDPNFLQSVLYYNDQRLFIGDWYPRAVGLGYPGGYTTGPITEEGVYIKVTPLMGKSDWELAKKQALMILSSFYKTKPYLKRKDLGYNKKKDADTYIMIEKAIMKADLDKVDKRKILFDRALESIIADKDFDDFNQENKYKEGLKSTYYEMTKRFRLPTVIDLTKLELLIS